MKKQLFIETIEAIQKQAEYDKQVAINLSNAFPDSQIDDLYPVNHFLENALIHLLQIEMNDLQLCQYGQTWIEYFCWELNFGKENYRLTVTQNGHVVPMSNAGELYNFLKTNK